jgi:hypothetical protein
MTYPLLWQKELSVPSERVNNRGSLSHLRTAVLAFHSCPFTTRITMRCSVFTPWINQTPYNFSRTQLRSVDNACTLRSDATVEGRACCCASSS